MKILVRFERRAMEDIVTDVKIKADTYESVGKHKLIKKIMKAIDMTLRKDWPRKRYSLDDILKPGKIFD